MQQLTHFAPQLYIPAGTRQIDFYTTGLGARLLRQWNNEDGSIHVAELAIDNNLFHVHEENPGKGQLEPGQHNGTTVLIGLFIEDVDGLINQAVAAGAQLLASPQDFDYGYRQGMFKDPFGHHWMIQKKLR